MSCVRSLCEVSVVYVCLCGVSECVCVCERNKEKSLSCTKEHINKAKIAQQDNLLLPKGCNRTQTSRHTRVGSSLNS